MLKRNNAKTQWSTLLENDYQNWKIKKKIDQSNCIGQTKSNNCFDIDVIFIFAIQSIQQIPS